MGGKTPWAPPEKTVVFWNARAVFSPYLMQLPLTMITATNLLKFATTVLLGSLITAPHLAQAQPAPPIPKMESFTTPVPAGELDFQPLETALIAKQFNQANEATRRLLLAATNRTRQGWLTTDTIEQISCGNLEKIDQLWLKYSDNRFGFTPQLQAFLATGNRPGRLMSPESYDKFGDRIGWRKDNQWIIFKKNLDFTINAPAGHLPSPRDEYQINGGRLEYTALMGRFQACQGGQTNDSDKPIKFTPFSM